MDTSEQYIKMCEKAEEIQTYADEYLDSFSVSCWYAPNHVQCKGHFTDWHMAYKFCPVCCKPLKITPEYSICHRMKGDDTIWLPRQDQLQEMLDVHHYTLLEKCWDFAQSTNGWMFDSMEQLWLAFVMKEKYNKLWNGEGWQVSPE